MQKTIAVQLSSMRSTSRELGKDALLATSRHLPELIILPRTLT